MAFVNEIIPPEFHRRLREIALARGVRREPVLSKWTADRERGLFLFKTHHWGGPYEGTNEEQHLVRGCGEEFVAFVAEAANTTASPQDGVLTWRVRSIEIPSSLNRSHQEVRALIVDALKQRGWLFGRHDECTVEVEFA
jgi:hypothetical protein